MYITLDGCRSTTPLCRTTEWSCESIKPEFIQKSSIDHQCYTSLCLSLSTFEANHGPSSALPACVIMKTAEVNRSSSSTATKLAADPKYKDKNDGDDFCKDIELIVQSLIIYNEFCLCFNAVAISSD